MNKKNYFERFKHISKADYIVIIFMTLLLIFAFYMSIAFSVKMSQGFTLFGDANSFDASKIETSGPTAADISVLITHWVLTGLLLALDIYFIFFKKPEEKKYVKKEIVDGKTVVVKEEKHDHK